jgi:hypothetical protein
MPSTPTDKLLNPPRGGGKLMEKYGFRSAERCLRSLSKQIPAIATKTLAEDTIFIGKSDRLLARIFILFLGSNRNLQEGTERTESYQRTDPFGLLQKETKVTKNHSQRSNSTADFPADGADGHG